MSSIQLFLSSDAPSVSLYWSALRESFEVTAGWSSNVYINRIERHLFSVTGATNEWGGIFVLRAWELRGVMSGILGECLGLDLPGVVESVVTLTLAS